MKLDKEEVAIFWFRRDLRLEDNTALFEALTKGIPVLPIFIFDPTILNQFEKGENAQVAFILKEINRLREELAKYNSSIKVFFASPVDAYEELAHKYVIRSVYTNEDYELSAIRRDNEIADFFNTQNIPFHSFKDEVIFSKNDVLKENGTPYTVFTPYSKRWKERLAETPIQYYPSEKHLSNLYSFSDTYIPSLSDLGFLSRNVEIPDRNINEDLIKRYDKQRDFPSIKGTSRLGIHLRFGTISIRQLVNKALSINDIFLNELIWRDFYQSITYHFPHICEGKAFKKQYDNIKWSNNEDLFSAWCEGKTGYPMVDAGMRELNATGFMHNRLRMITASFLVKHLLIDWRWGEAYFANKLIDFDFAANNGGWQWAASSGCDAVPYFRIFNPELQASKFDKDEVYIRQWIPEYGTDNYVNPIVEHKQARQKAIDTYKIALKHE